MQTTIGVRFKPYTAEILLAGILVLSGFLNLWNIWNQGFTNEYYAATVRSMLDNPALMFFSPFDAAGFVTVDKPPVGLWVQAGSAALFGFSGFALVLPQALAGVGSVALVYAIVSRPFGKAAGLVSAFALAITPIFVAVSRNATQDGLLIFLVLLALWVALKATRDRSPGLLVISLALVGIAFNIKMIQAWIVVPAILVVYLLGAGDISLKKRVLHLVVATAVLLAVSLSWAVAVDMVPADQRPYIGGSGDNSVLSLILNYNGMHRLENGMGSGGPGLGPGGLAGTRSLDSPAPGIPPADRAGDVPGVTGSRPDTGRAPGMGDTGIPGAFRLFSGELAGQLSWLLPFALIGLLVWLRRPPVSSPARAGLLPALGEKGCTLAAMCLWLLPGLLYFSFTTGFWHPYYLATIAPPIAALAGIGAVGMYGAYCAGERKGWILVFAVAVTGCTQVWILLPDADWAGLLIPLVLAGTIIASVLLAGLKVAGKTSAGSLSKGIAIIAIGLLFLTPLAWACTPLYYGGGGILPSAGPRATAGAGGGMFTETGGSTDGLAPYLISHRTGERWIVAVPSSNSQGSRLIIGTGEPVMSLGGFAGSDRILTADSLASLIRAGEIRFFLVPGPGGGRASANSGLFAFVRENCEAVDPSAWSTGDRGMGPAANLSGPAGFPGYSTGPPYPPDIPGDGNGIAPEPGLPREPGNQTSHYPGYGRPPAQVNETRFPGWSGVIATRDATGQGSATTLYDCACYRDQEAA